MSSFEQFVTTTKQLFEKQFKNSPKWVVSAPGRVNLIGEHTDYNDGFVFPMAIERQTVIVAAPIEENVANIYSIQTGEQVELVIDGTSVPPKTHEDVKWSSYVQGVITGCVEAGLKPSSGFFALINSNVPLGGGLSSSASLEVATATLMEAITGQKLETVQKPLLCQKVEHEYAHMPCGIMDQFTSALAEKGHAMLLDCKTREPKMVPITDPDVSVLIINSNKKHTLTGSEYPERRKCCYEAAEILGVSKLREANLEMLETARGKMSEKQYQRAKHVVSEDIRTQTMAIALAERDWEYCGQLMYRSHFSLSIDFEVSTPELDLLVSLARIIGFEGGVYGSRMTGGGFGGCTVSLVKTDRVDEISRAIAERYQSVIGIEPTIFATHPAQGATILE